MARRDIREMRGTIRRHNLHIDKDGQAAVFVVGEPSWHRLGKRLDHAVISAVAIVQSRLNWKVIKLPNHTRLPDGSEAAVPGSFAIVRADTNAVLGAVGARYTPMQNEEAFAFMDALTGDKLAMYESAGALQGGRIVWMLARIPRTLYATAKDEVLPYVLLTNRHDGRSAVWMLPTTVRVECNNTLNLALNLADDGVGGGYALRVRHSRNIHEQIHRARRNLGLINARVDQFGHEIRALSRRQVRQREVVNFLEQFFPVHWETNRDSVADQGAAVLGDDGASLLEQALANQEDVFALTRDLLEAHRAEMDKTARRHAKILDRILTNFEQEKPNAWGLYNSVSAWADHQRVFRGADDDARADRQLQSIWFGDSNQLKQEAFSQALQLTA